MNSSLARMHIYNIYSTYYSIIKIHEQEHRMSVFMTNQESSVECSESESLQAQITDVEEHLFAMKALLASIQEKPPNIPSTSQSTGSDPSEYGYVYILQADLRELCCDYWFGASGGVLEPMKLNDFPNDSTSKVPVSCVPGDENMEDIWKMFTYEPWPEGVPKPYTVRVNNSGKSNTQEYIAQVGRYLRAAAQHAHAPCRQPFRSAFRKSTCPLMATPLIGTGWGGNQRNTGEMALQLLPTLYALANELHIDVALVTNDKEVYALMQWARSKMLTTGAEMPYYATISGRRYLSEYHNKRMDELAHHAIQGQLSLFIGAGASMGSRVPDWFGLVESLADELGLTEERRKEFSKVDVYTKAAVLEAEVERRHKISGDLTHDGSKEKSMCLGDYVARRFKHSRYSVVHALLAALPVQEAITTNYDDLFEKAWQLHGNFAVLPHAPMRRSGGHLASSKWLLKMHGCVTKPEEIVLTKSHYIRYAERYAALAGIVQASLLTRHLLFVGFSFDDDNFQRIYDPVRKARCQERQSKAKSASDKNYTEPVEKGQTIKSYSKISTSTDPHQGNRNGTDSEVECCGTALLLEYSMLKEELWEGDICMTSMGPTVADALRQDNMQREKHMSSLARKQEIFLDLLGSKCAVSLQMEFLMNKKFEKALSPTELLLRDTVLEFETNLLSLPQESKNNVAFGRIMDMLKSLGSTSR